MSFVFYLWDKVSCWLYFPWFTKKHDKIDEIDEIEFTTEPLLRK